MDSDTEDAFYTEPPRATGPKKGLRSSLHEFSTQQIVIIQSIFAVCIAGRKTVLSLGTFSEKLLSHSSHSFGDCEATGYHHMLCNVLVNFFRAGLGSLGDAQWCRVQE